MRSIINIRIWKILVVFLNWWNQRIKLKQDVENLGFKVHIQEDVEDFTTGKRTNEDKWRKLKKDPFKNYFKVIKNSDAILVVNIDKKGVKGYIGGNTLIEMAFAHILDKKIYLLNQIPDLSYKDEIEAFKPIILNSDLLLMKGGKEKW